jgi:hypothetical protein
MQQFMQKNSLSLSCISISCYNHRAGGLDSNPHKAALHLQYGSFGHGEPIPTSIPERWMMDAQETLFHQIPVPWLTTKLRLVSAVTIYYLLTTQ